METVTINSEKIKQAIDNYMQDYILEVFEFFIGEPLYNYAKMLYNTNIIVFDLDKFEKLFEYGDDYKDYIGLSLKDSIIKKYDPVLALFIEEIVCHNQFMTIGIITE